VGFTSFICVILASLYHGWFSVSGTWEPCFEISDLRRRSTENLS